MMANPSNLIRPLMRWEQAELVSWAQKEGWNPGLHDADLFWEVDPEGFLGIEVDEVFAGGGAIIRHNPSFGFMGLFIMRPQYRSKKLGTKLWIARRDRLLSRLDAAATIGLDAVDAMVPFYARGGFVPYVRHVRFEWEAPSAQREMTSAVVPLTQIPLEKLLEYDLSCFPGPRKHYLELWTRQEGAQAIGILEGNQLVGYSVMRRCVIGWKIGPLFADSLDVAQELLSAHGRCSAGERVFLDAPQNNPAATELCCSHGMREVFGCVRMYLGTAPDIENHKIFSITNFEIG
jgi:GNAT superfamily N-acetyltransferase